MGLQSVRVAVSHGARSRVRLSITCEGSAALENGGNAGGGSDGVCRHAQERASVVSRRRANRQFCVVTTRSFEFGSRFKVQSRSAAIAAFPVALILGRPAVAEVRRDLEASSFNPTASLWTTFAIDLLFRNRAGVFFSIGILLVQGDAMDDLGNRRRRLHSSIDLCIAAGCQGARANDWISHSTASDFSADTNRRKSDFEKTKRLTELPRWVAPTPRRNLNSRASAVLNRRVLLIDLLHFALYAPRVPRICIG